MSSQLLLCSCGHDGSPLCDCSCGSSSSCCCIDPEEPETECDCEDFCTDSTEPVRYHNGQIQMTVSDIALTDGAFTYSHSRKYDNLETIEDDGPNGFGWKTMKYPRVIRYSGFRRVEFAENDSVHFSLQADPSGDFERIGLVSH